MQSDNFTVGDLALSVAVVLATVTARVEYGGRVFDEDTDFLVELRAAVKASGPSWLRADLPHPWAITDWGEAVAAAPVLAARLAEAAMALIESGTRDEAELASVLPYEKATDGVARALAVFERDRERFGRTPGAHAMVLWN